LIAIASFEIDVYSKRLGLPRDRFMLIPLGTDFGSIVPPQDPPAPTSPIIASIGRVERYKGHHRLIRALPAILARRPDVKVWIAGSGPYEDNLWRMARKLGVAEHLDISAVDGTDREAMARKLSTVALAVLFSDFETQPAAVLEAIALGRPVLVLDTTGLGDLARDGLARAIPRASSTEEIAAAVLQELETPFRPRRVDLPTWDDCARQHIDLYTSLTHGEEIDGR
jgi:glycosyltransferase involved in cell wall biosynthesis